MVGPSPFLTQTHLIQYQSKRKLDDKSFFGKLTFNLIVLKYYENKYPIIISIYSNVSRQLKTQAPNRPISLGIDIR